MTRRQPAGASHADRPCHHTRRYRCGHDHPAGTRAWAGGQDRGRSGPMARPRTGPTGRQRGGLPLRGRLVGYTVTEGCTVAFLVAPFFHRRTAHRQSQDSSPPRGSCTCGAHRRLLHREPGPARRRRRFNAGVGFSDRLRAPCVPLHRRSAISGRWSGFYSLYGLGARQTGSRIEEPGERLAKTV